MIEVIVKKLVIFLAILGFALHLNVHSGFTLEEKNTNESQVIYIFKKEKFKIYSNIIFNFLTVNNLNFFYFDEFKRKKKFNRSDVYIKIDSAHFFDADTRDNLIEMKPNSESIIRAMYQIKCGYYDYSGEGDSGLDKILFINNSSEKKMNECLRSLELIK